MKLTKQIEEIARNVAAVVFPLMSIALAVLIFVTLAAQLGFPMRFVRALSATELAYLCGAVWLWRKAT